LLSGKKARIFWPYFPFARQLLNIKQDVVLKKIVSGILIVVFTTLLLRSFAQEEDTLTLPVFKLEKSRINEYSTGQKVQPIEIENIRNNPSLNLSDILSQKTNIFLKPTVFPAFPHHLLEAHQQTTRLFYGMDLTSKVP
jgi:hypothetical protein